MIKINERSIFSGLLFLFAVIILYKTFDLGPDAALVPRLVGLIMLVMSGLQLGNDLLPAVQKRLPFLNRSNIGNLETQNAQNAQDDQDETEESVRSRYFFAGWMVLFVLLIYFTSMIWAILFSLFIYLKWINKESWKMSILYPVITGVFVYMVFVKGFELTFFF
jgi:hypothetical protein